MKTRTQLPGLQRTGLAVSRGHLHSPVDDGLTVSERGCWSLHRTARAHVCISEAGSHKGQDSVTEAEKTRRFLWGLTPALPWGQMCVFLGIHPAGSPGDASIPMSSRRRSYAEPEAPLLSGTRASRSACGLGGWAAGATVSQSSAPPGPGSVPCPSHMPTWEARCAGGSPQPCSGPTAGTALYPLIL